jgi:hemolysin activation/secretion protein
VAQGLAADLQGTITAAAGASAGALPAQRLWYLGGAHTVRGHRAGAVAGDAFWLARAELAKGHPLIRPSLFADLGWAGARDRWRDDVIPVAGVGVGASTLDGLVRLDLARSTRGGGRWTAYFYFDPR